MDISTLKNDFHQTFQRTEEPRVFFAPGRINLIGEHTDYNGGHVFPAAISFGTYAIALPREDNFIHLYSKNCCENRIIKVTLDDLSLNEPDE